MKSGTSTAKGVHKNATAIRSGAVLLREGGRGAAAQASQAQMAGSIASIKTSLKQFCRELCPGLDPDKIFKALNLGGVEKFATGVAKTGWQKHSIARSPRSRSRLASTPRRSPASRSALAPTPAR